MPGKSGRDITEETRLSPEEEEDEEADVAHFLQKHIELNPFSKKSVRLSPGSVDRPGRTAGVPLGGEKR